MNLTCKHCKQSVPPDDMNAAKGMAVCPNCHAVFALSPEGEVQTTINLDIPQPAGYRVEQDIDGLHIIYSWRKGSVLFSIFAVLLVNLLVGWWLVDAFNHQRIDQAVVGLLFLAFGVSVIYGLLLTIFNRTDIVIGAAQLTVRHSPLPARGNRTLDNARLRQIYVDEVKRRARNRMQTHYRVRVALRDQEEVVLVDHLADPNEGFYIAHQIERRLCIEAK